MSDEIAKLKQKLTELEFKLNVKTLDLKECKAKLAEQRSKFAEYKATHKIRMLESIKKDSEKIDLAPALKEAKERMDKVGTGEDEKP